VFNIVLMLFVVTGPSEKEGIVGVSKTQSEIVSGVVAAFSVLFLIPLTLLFVVQTQNFCLGRTTNERFARKNGSKTEGEEEEVTSSSKCMNFCSMCFNSQEHLTQVERLPYKVPVDFNYSLIVNDYTRTSS
jgi:hypothetical protein